MNETISIFKSISQGCYDALMEYFKEKAALCGGIAVAVFVLQVSTLNRFNSNINLRHNKYII